jgi:hypothetical protein
MINLILIVIGTFHPLLHPVGKHEKQQWETARPCEYFDLICGTGTGGLIALMIGRMGMVCLGVFQAHGVMDG